MHPLPPLYWNPCQSSVGHSSIFGVARLSVFSHVRKDPWGFSYSECKLYREDHFDGNATLYSKEGAVLN